MKYMLVLQFPEEMYSNYDWVDDVEGKIDLSLNDALLDGHDVGSGEFNIFIQTNNVDSTFETVKNILEEYKSMDKVKIAYRSLDGDNFTILWPKDLDKFEIL